MALSQRVQQTAASTSTRAMAPVRVGRVGRVARSSNGAAPAGFAGVQVQHTLRAARAGRKAANAVMAAAIKTGATIDGRKLRVAVIGGGPSGACAAETLAKNGIEAFLIERKLDNCKVRCCRVVRAGDAILCCVRDFF